MGSFEDPFNAILQIDRDSNKSHVHQNKCCERDYLNFLEVGIIVSHGLVFGYHVSLSRSRSVW